MGTLLQQPQTSWRGRSGNMKCRITYADDGTAYSFPPLPAGAILRGTHRKITAVFNDSGADEIEVGTAADPDAFNKVADTTATTLGDYSTCSGDNAPPYQLAAATTIQVLYSGGNGDSTTGSCDVTIFYDLVTP